MSHKYRPAKSRTDRETITYKGKAPLKIDLLLYGILKSIIAILLLYIIYFLSVDYLRLLSYYTIFLEIMFVFFLMVFCDFLGVIFASLLDDYIIHKWGYLRNQKNKRNFMYRTTDYTIYTLIRTLCLITSFVWVVSAWFYHTLNSPWNQYSFLVAWFTLSLASKLISWMITVKIYGL